MLKNNKENSSASGDKKTSDGGRALDFVREIVAQDVGNGKNNGRVVTRFPPEPNGYLHIGHAKSICLNFGIAKENNSICHLRFDDTNPAKEDVEYVDSIREDVKWLGFDWKDKEFYASDYFDKFYEYALELIKKSLAYVDDLTTDEIRKHRGTLTEAGKESPYRNRSVDENLKLFEGMRSGEFEEGTRVLRAKIDMTSPNINLRDPTIYRIKKTDHHRTASKWCIYPMYDFAHCLSDSIEGITHSICTLEFENNRPLYDWILDALQTPCHPQQIEFARLNLNYTILSKRKLLRLVEEKIVSGWDDPRMPTISGFRRRGYTPEAIRTFAERIGVSKVESVVDMAFLEHCLREDLNRRSKRVMAVLRPLKVIIDNYPEGKTEMLDAVNNPEDPGAGTRQIPFSKVLYIEKEDFRENPSKDFFRLSPGKEVRLRYAYFLKCEKVIKDPETGEALELHCTYDPTTRGGNNPADGRKVKATIHWVSAEQAVSGEARLYEHLFTKANPNEEIEGKDFTNFINPKSLEVLKDCRLEPCLAGAKAGSRYQFERLGYFCTDSDTKPGHLVFNRTVTLRDELAKIEQKKKK